MKQMEITITLPNGTVVCMDYEQWKKLYEQLAILYSHKTYTQDVVQRLWPDFPKYTLTGV